MLLIPFNFYIATTLIKTRRKGNYDTLEEVLYEAYVYNDYKLWLGTCSTTDL